MRYAIVNPEDDTDIYEVDLDGRQIVDRATVRIPTFPGERTTVVNSGADFDRNAYDLVESTTVCVEYQQPTRSYTFDEPGARVVESISCPYIPIDDMLQARLAELAQLYSAVYDQGVTVTIESDGVQDMHTSNFYYAQYDSIGDTSLPSVTVHHVPGLWVGESVQLTPPDCAQGSNLKTSLSLHYSQTNAVNGQHMDALVDLHTAGDSAGLAAYDIYTDWPAAPTPPAGQAASLATRQPLVRTVEIDTLVRALEHPRVQGTPGGVGHRVAYVYRFLLRYYEIRDDVQQLFAAWLAEHPGA